MPVSLSDFSPYFELLTGINLGYAIFDYFRNQLSKGVFNIDKSISLKLDYLQNRLKIQISEKSNNPEFSKLLQNINEEVKVSSESLEQLELNERTFIEILKPISYISAFFCLVVLLISGFIGNEPSNSVLKLNLLYVVYIFGVLSAIFSFAIFSGTFSTRILTNKQVLPLQQIILSLILFLFLSYLVVFSFKEGERYDWEILLIYLFPFILYSLFSLVNILKVEGYCVRKRKDNFLNSFKLCKSNFLYSVGFLCVLSVFFTPVGMHLKDKETCKYSLYLVTLTVPILLYLFMPIRVFIHKTNFKNKYLKLCKKQTAELDYVISKIE